MSEIIERALLLVNANSRRGELAREEAHQALTDVGIEVIDESPDGPDAMEPLMQKHRERVDAVVVGGGDGTILSSVGGAIASGLPLGIIPLGTFNELARTLAIPLDVKAAAQLLRNGVKRPIDVGSVNGKYFINEASLGLSTRIARLQTTDVKRRWGFLAMIPTTLRVLPDVKPFRVTIDVDGEPPPELTLHAVQVTVANSYRFGTILENKEAAIDDGMLDLYSVDIHGWSDFFPVLASAMTGHFRDKGGLRTMRAPGFTIRTRRPRHVFADGDYATMTPAEFRVHPLALTVFAAKPAPTP